MWAALALALPFLAVPGSAIAHDAGNTPEYGIVNTFDLMAPGGIPADQTYNGFKVFLSSPDIPILGAAGSA